MGDIYKAIDIGLPPRETGVVPPVEVVAQSGLDFLRSIGDGERPMPPMAGVIPVRPVEVEFGRIVFEGEPGAAFYNTLGTVHGGYAATLLDTAMGCAVHSTLPAGRGYTTLELKTNFVRPMTETTGRVTVEGRIIHTGGRVATAEGFLRDSEGRLLAHGTTTCMVLAGGR